MNNCETIWTALVENGIDRVAYLPCNKLNAMMKQCPTTIDLLHITREATGLGLAFGRSLAGKRSALFIQNTGLGNLITELYTLQKLYQVGLPLFVSWRGHYQEPIEAQVILGNRVEPLLAAVGVEYTILEKSADLTTLRTELKTCFKEQKVKVFLISPALWEENIPDYHLFGQPRFDRVELLAEEYTATPVLNRSQAIQRAMEVVGEEDIVISQIGFPSRELHHHSDRALNFYLLGALGSATEVGIGMAMELPDRHIFVFDGDGALFFNPNQLFDLATYQPSNLTVICLDNGSWGSTGNQPTLSSSGLNLSAILRSMGVDRALMTDDLTQYQEMITSKRVPFLHFLISAGNDKAALEIPIGAVEIKRRFLNALG